MKGIILAGALMGGIIYAYHAHDPERYGVVDFDEN